MCIIKGVDFYNEISKTHQISPKIKQILCQNGIKFHMIFPLPTNQKISMINLLWFKYTWTEKDYQTKQNSHSKNKEEIIWGWNKTQ